MAIDQDDEKSMFLPSWMPQGETNDNALFKLSGSRLTTNAELDFETSEHHTITVQVTWTTPTFVQDLLIHVSNGNDAPTGATLNNNGSPRTYLPTPRSAPSQLPIQTAPMSTPLPSPGAPTRPFPNPR